MRAVFRVLGIVVLSLAVGQAALSTATAATSTTKQRATSDVPSVTLRVQAGWAGHYRQGPAWTPVYVTLTNTGSQNVQGVLEIPDTTIAAAVQLRVTVGAVYSASVVLLPGASKNVILYVPGIDIPREVDVQFRVHRTIAASASAFPNDFDPHDITVGAVTTTPDSLSWLAGLKIGRSLVDVISLPPVTLSTFPEALASFDVIVLSNVDTSQMNSAQLDALERYVRDGGSVLIIGGSSAAATLGGLPTALIPGRLLGTRTITSLAGLGTLGYGAPPRGAAPVGVLAVSHGVVLAQQGGIPLIARTSLDVGTVAYVAFDPSTDPVASWRHAPELSVAMLRAAVPQAIRRLSMPMGYGSASFLAPQGGAIDIARQLGNLPAAPAQLLILFVLVLLAYVIAVGPVSVFLGRSLRRPGRIWFMAPALALIFGAVVLGVAPRAGTAVVRVNVVGAVHMDGPRGAYPADLYIGLQAPSSKTYRLSYSMPGFASPVIPASAVDLKASSGNSPAWRFDEGSKASAEFINMPAGEVRGMALTTQAQIMGTIHSCLHIDAGGAIVGSVQNATSFDLVQASIIAGRRWVKLPDLAPGATVQVHLLSADDVHNSDYSSLLFKVYGQASVVGPAAASDENRDLSARIRDAVSTLPETNVLSMLGEVTFVAWTQQPTGTFTVDGARTSVRSLTMLTKGLSVQFPRGQFQLRTGTIGAHLVDETQSLARYACCSPSAQAVYIGAHGSATFEFDIPHTPHLRFHSLALSVYAGGPDPSYTGYSDVPAGAVTVYNWRSNRWTPLTFRAGATSLLQPNDDISATGALLVRLHVDNDANDLTIADPGHDLQISGAASA